MKNMAQNVWYVFTAKSIAYSDEIHNTELARECFILVTMCNNWRKYHEKLTLAVFRQWNIKTNPRAKMISGLEEKLKNTELNRDLLNRNRHFA
jgi:hypothetical protein